MEPVPHIDAKTYDMAKRAIEHLQAQLATANRKLEVAMESLQFYAEAFPRLAGDKARAAIKTITEMKD